MNSKHPLMDSQAGNIVYVKPVPISELPEEVQEEARAEAGGAEMLYALYREDGEQLALVADRELAYMLARENDLSPVSLH